MKKILLLLLTVLTFTSCVDVYRSDDVFVVISKENGNTSYKYLYRTQHYMRSTTSKNGLYYLDDYFFVTNENYELGDTIKFIRYASNKR